MPFIITVFDRWEGSYRPIYYNRAEDIIQTFATRKAAEAEAATYRGSDGRFSRVEVHESDDLPPLF